MKIHEDKTNICMSFNSLDEYISQLFDQDIEFMASAIKRKPVFACVKDLAELLAKINYDEELVSTYNKIRADIYLPSKKSVATVKQYRDSGNHFSYTRYLDGRPCVWKGKKVEIEGSKSSRTIPIIVNIAEPWFATKEEMTFKAIAAAEMVKAIQSQGKNVELFVTAWTHLPTKGRYDTVHIIKIKGGADPLVIPRLLASVSPYFFRAYMILAQSRYLRYKDYTPSRNNIMRKGCGSVKNINTDRKEFFRLIGALGISGVDNAIIIDSGEVTDQNSLENFRKKHGITLH